jgi:hypothetical protein
MGKSSREFMQLREQRRQYPMTPEECFFESKPCPDCDGWGLIAESKCCGGSITNGICNVCNQVTEPTVCTTCDGNGVIPKTEEDFNNEKENEIIGNDEMMRDE